MKFGEGFRKIVTGAALVVAGAGISEKAGAQNTHTEKPKMEQTRESEKQIIESMQVLASKLIQENIIKLDTEHYDGFTYIGKLGKYDIKFIDYKNDKNVNLGESGQDRFFIGYGDDEKDVRYSVEKNVTGLYGTAYAKTAMPGLKKMSWQEFESLARVFGKDQDMYAKKLTLNEIQKIVEEFKTFSDR